MLKCSINEFMSPLAFRTTVITAFLLLSFRQPAVLAEFVLYFCSFLCPEPGLYILLILNSRISQDIMLKVDKVTYSCYLFLVLVVSDSSS